MREIYIYDESRENEYGVYTSRHKGEECGRFIELTLVFEMKYESDGVAVIWR